jgi:hypothetical protein
MEKTKHGSERSDEDLISYLARRLRYLNAMHSSNLEIYTLAAITVTCEASLQILLLLDLRRAATLILTSGNKGSPIVLGASFRITDESDSERYLNGDLMLHVM